MASPEGSISFQASTTDFSAVLALLEIPSIREACLWPEKTTFQPPPGATCVRVILHGTPAGCFLTVPRPMSLEVHTLLTRHGLTAVRIARQFLLWLLANSSCGVFQTHAKNAPAKMLAYALGLRVIARNDDTTYFEATRGELCELANGRVHTKRESLSECQSEPSEQ